MATMTDLGPICFACGEPGIFNHSLEVGHNIFKILYYCSDHVQSAKAIYVPWYEMEEKKERIMEGQILKEGTKKDEGKPRWELIAYDALGGIAKILTLGAIKYDARNWEKGIAYGRVFGAIMRHLTAWWSGDSLDSESGLSHLDHAMCELMFLSAYEKRGMTKFDDRPGKVS